jgi:hypothetical protein
MWKRFSSLLSHDLTVKSLNFFGNGSSCRLSLVSNTSNAGKTSCTGRCNEDDDLPEIIKIRDSAQMVPHQSGQGFPVKQSHTGRKVVGR